MVYRHPLMEMLDGYLKGSVLAIPMLIVALATGSFGWAVAFILPVMWPYAFYIWEYKPFDSLEEGIFMAAICVFCFLYYQAVLWTPSLFKLI